MVDPDPMHQPLTVALTISPTRTAWTSNVVVAGALAEGPPAASVHVFRGWHLILRMPAGTVKG